MSARQIIIAGAGEAGVAAAAALHDAGYDGTIVLIGEEPHLPYERPPLSKEMILGTQDGLKPIRPEQWYEQAGIDLRVGMRVERIDPVARAITIVDAAGVESELAYDDLLLATGARVRELSGAAADIAYLRTHEDGERLRARLTGISRIVVIGGGVIGLEVASSARALGLDVTVIDPAARLMARALVPEISRILLDLHRAAGVDVRTDTGSINIDATGATPSVILADNERIEADLIVAGIGVVPNVELGEMAGCAIDNGIVVDGAGRTSVPHVFAAGDVATFHHPTFHRAMRVEAWQHAGRHGAHVARAILGKGDDYCEVPWFWTDQLGVNIQVAGVIADCDATYWRGEGNSRTAFHFASDALVAVTTINNGRDIRPATKLLAAGWRGDPSDIVDPTLAFGKISQRLLSEMAL